MERTLRFRAVFEKHGSWYVGYIPEVPGVNAQERTLKLARASLMRAIHELAEIDPMISQGTGVSTRKVSDLSSSRWFPHPWLF